MKLTALYIVQQWEVLYCHSDNREVFRHDCSLTATGHALESKRLPNQSWQAAHGLRVQAVLADRPVCMEISVLQNQVHGLQWSHCSTAKENSGPCHATNGLCRVVEVFNSAWQGLFTQIIYCSFFKRLWLVFPQKLMFLALICNLPEASKA